MKLEKAHNRDRKKSKKRSGMQVDNKSIFTLQETIVKKGKKNQE